MPGYTIKVPASAANIGPGFDAIGIALNIYNTLKLNVSSEVSDNPSVFISSSGEYEKYGINTPIPQDKTNLVYQVFADAMLKMNRKMPKEIIMEFETDIPASRGIGSSTTAILMGMFAAFATAGVQPNPGLCLDTLYKMEGHLDNGAPALLGGVTINWVEEGNPFVRQHPFNEGLELKLIIPKFEASTKEARDSLPPTVFYEDAVFNISRTALLLNVLISPTFSNQDLFMATDDKLHQKYRKKVYGKSYELLEDLREAHYPACISGAGPTILIIMNKNQLKENLSIEEIVGDNPDFVIEDVEISRSGTEVSVMA
jgi:homoserine kinase